MSSLPEQQAVYSVNERRDVLKHLPRRAQSVLDVGCGMGGFGQALRRSMGTELHIDGIDPMSDHVKSSLKTGAYNHVYQGYFPDSMPTSRYDVVVYNDVLEHIVDPWQTLRSTKNFLTDGGCVLAAIPNIQYAPAFRDLAHGRWEYVDSGILDRTHLRFFTRSGSISLMESSGYEVVSIAGENSVWTMEWGRYASQPSVLEKIKRRVILRLMPDSEWLHHVILARPA